MKIYNVIISPHFNNMVRRTLKFYKKFSKTYSLKVEQKILSIIYILSFFPYSFSLIDFSFISGDFRKVNILNRFLIIYKISKDNVFLLYFFDGRRNINSSDLFKK